MLKYRWLFVIPATPATGQLFINSLWTMTTFPWCWKKCRYIVIVNYKNECWEGDYLVLAKTWGISSKKKLNMICGTTQHGVHTILHPLLSWWFRTNDHKLGYRRLPHNVYSNTLFANTVYIRGNKHARIFAIDFGWSCSFPIKLKIRTYEALSLLFQQEGVLTQIICKDAKEMIKGQFNRKLREASWWLR